MRRKAMKLREFSLGGAKVNSTCIGTFLQTYFVVGDSHNNIRLYTFQNQEEIQIYSNPTNSTVQTEVTAVALSCIQKQIFSGTNRGIINLWDMETAKASSSLKGHSTAVNCFGVFPQQPQKLASGSYDTCIKLWDIREKNCNATLKGHSKPINSIAISPDGNMLLSGSQDNTARLWDMRITEKPIYIATEHNGPLLKVKFNPQDCMFATCSSDKTAKYFRCQQKCYGFTSSTDMVATPVTAIGFSDDGKTLFTAANDVLKSWNMYKNGLLIQTFDASWKGVQEINMIKGALMGIAFSAGSLSLWACDVQKKIKNTSQISQSSFVLPNINRNKLDNQNQMKELQNLVGIATEKVKNIEDKPVNQNIEKRKQEMEKRRQEIERKKQEDQKKKRQLQLEREKERERLKQAKEKAKRQEQAKKKQQLQKLQQKLFQERQERDRIMQEQIQKTLQQRSNQMQNTIDHDVLENSSLMNISTFVADGAQKQKLIQMEMIGELLKTSSKYESILKDRSSSIKPIINFWKQGRINTALQLIQKSSHLVMSDCINAILSFPMFKSAITPEVGITLSACLREIMTITKHSILLAATFNNLNLIVLLFKDELIKIKTFNPMTRVDISREERMVKYDKLFQEFLSVFKEERLKKYCQKKKNGQKGENQQVNQLAFELYNNLQDILKKILPKRQAQMA